MISTFDSRMKKKSVKIADISVQLACETNTLIAGFFLLFYRYIREYIAKDPRAVIL